jgi:hypothetical protein
MLPGAFRVGDLDIEQGYGGDDFTAAIEEEDEEQTPVVTREQSINPISATLVDAKEEEMRVQEKINQALQRERQQAVVAQVAPANKWRKWFVIGTFFLLVVALTTALALTLPPTSPSNCGKDGYFGPNCDRYLPDCAVPNPQWIGNGACDGDVYNTEACGWDGTDCPPPCDNDGYFGPKCDLYYPNCSVPNPEWIGDGDCDGDVYNTTECEWDGMDCSPLCDNDGYFGPNCDLHYPNCSVPNPQWIGDGACDGDVYNTEACGYDGTDCCDKDGYFGPNCTLYYPNCSVPNPEWIGDGVCDGDVYNTAECGYDGTDCSSPCDNDGYFGPNCDLHYPNCSVPSQYRNWIGNGFCDDVYNTTECGNDGGDCIPCKDGYTGFNCTLYLPNCTVPFPESQWIGDGFCDDIYNTTECGNEGGDCL